MAQDNNKILEMSGSSSSLVSPNSITEFKDNNRDELDNPLLNFTYALKAPETKRQYPRRLKVFMDFVKLDGDLTKQAMFLKEKIQKEPEWFKTSLIRFFEFQKERARRNDIAFSTISNYYKAIKHYPIEIHLICFVA